MVASSYEFVKEYNTSCGRISKHLFEMKYEMIKN